MSKFVGVAFAVTLAVVGGGITSNALAASPPDHEGIPAPSTATIVSSYTARASDRKDPMTTPASNAVHVIYNYPGYAKHANDLTVRVYNHGKIINEKFAYESSPPIHGMLLAQTNPVLASGVYIRNLLPSWIVNGPANSWSNRTGTYSVTTHQTDEVTFQCVIGPNTNPQITRVNVYINSGIRIRTIHVYLYKLGRRYEWNIYKITESDATVPTSRSSRYTTKALAHMSPSQLAAYNMRNHTPLPFAGMHVIRDAPKSPLPVSSSRSHSIFHTTIPTDNGGLDANDYRVVDAWTGVIEGTRFHVEIDKKVGGGGYILGFKNGTETYAYQYNTPPHITNFTGSYMVFATHKLAPRHPFYALNLESGSLLPGWLLPSFVIPYEMSSAYEVKGRNDNRVVGLPKG